MALLVELEGDLLDVFSSFTQGAADMDGRTFVKCMKASKLLDNRSFKTSDADLIFVRNKMKGLRKINFKEFVQCLVEVAQKIGMEEDDVATMVTGASVPMSATTSNSSNTGSARGDMTAIPSNASSASTGPERFFYDKSLYTGTHRRGGPSVLGGGVEEGDVIRGDQLMNRDMSTTTSERPVRNGKLPVLLGGTPTPTSEKTTGMTMTNTLSMGRTMTPTLSMGRTVSMGRTRSHERASDGAHRPKSPMGPERFFYDKSTYTGTHRCGGPSVVGNGLPKQHGYEDLSLLVNRSVALDDALHRRKRGHA